MSDPLPAQSDQNPPEIQFHCAVFETAFHPLADVIAVGLVSGKIELCVLCLWFRALAYPNLPAHQLSESRRPLFADSVTQLMLVTGL